MKRNKHEITIAGPFDSLEAAQTWIKNTPWAESARVEVRPVEGGSCLTVSMLAKDFAKATKSHIKSEVKKNGRNYLSLRVRLAMAIKRSIHGASVKLANWTEVPEVFEMA